MLGSSPWAWLGCNSSAAQLSLVALECLTHKHGTGIKEVLWAGHLTQPWLQGGTQEVPGSLVSSLDRTCGLQYYGRNANCASETTHLRTDHGFNLFPFLHMFKRSSKLILRAEERMDI